MGTGHRVYGLMVLVPAGVEDVGPGGCLVTFVALFDFCVGLAGDLLGDHSEVLHVVAWGCLVALGTVHGSGGRVSEFGDCPRGCRVAGGAVLAEQIEVPIVVFVTGGAVKGRLFHGEVRVDQGGAGWSLVQQVQ